MRNHDSSLHTHLALVGVIVVGLLLGACSENQTMVAEADSLAEANRVVMALNEAGLTGASIERDAADRDVVWRVNVPREAVPEARRVLTRAHLPAPRHSGFRDFTQEQGLVPSGAEERAGLMQAHAGELAATWQANARVLEARVHVALPDGTSKTKAAASRDKNIKTTASRSHLPTAAVVIYYRAAESGTDGPTRLASGPLSVAPNAEDMNVPWKVVGGSEDLRLLRSGVFPLDPATVCVVTARAVPELLPENVSVAFVGVPAPSPVAAASLVPGVAAESSAPEVASMDEAEATTSGFPDRALFVFTAIVALGGLFFFFKWRRAAARSSAD